MGKRKLKPAAAVDVKTTGLSPSYGHRVIEIAAVRISGAGPCEAFHSLIDCGRKVTPGARQVHGISEAMLAGQPEPALNNAQAAGRIWVTKEGEKGKGKLSFPFG